uniref:Uncharacterized protein n=1 Tax=Lepeophtheirus salmonis TaxID=72036 RepID=A0A0K2T516_LEPSM
MLFSYRSMGKCEESFSPHFTLSASALPASQLHSQVRGRGQILISLMSLSLEFYKRNYEAIYRMSSSIRFVAKEMKNLWP